MERSAQALDYDSDETVIEGSVTENELEDEELPWRRLLLNRDTSLKSEFCFHSGVNGMWKGNIPSPVIQLGLKLGKDSEEQKDKNEELSENTDSPEISLLSGTSLVASDLVTLKEKSLAEPVKTLAVPNTFSETGTKDEESSLETFVSSLERLLESPEGTQEETLLEIVNNLNPQELMNPLSDSLSSVSIPLNALPACYRDVLENMKDNDALPAELLAAINTLPGGDVGPGPVGPICQGQEKSSSVSDGNGCLEVQPTMSQIDEDCTQITQTIEDPKPFRFQIMTHENDTSYEQLNNQGNSEPMENTSVQETPHVLRRSSRLRLKKLKESRAVAHTDIMLKIPEKILSKPLSYEDQTNSIFATENFRFHVAQFGLKLGWTALHEASVGGFYQTVSELLKGGADVNVKGKYQITPLHDAVMNGHYKVAELLLLNGADPLFRSDHGTCALDEAKDSFMENLLKKYIPKHKKCHLSDQRKSTDPSYAEDIFQYKKPKLSSNNHTDFICDENSNRQEPGHVETNKEINNLLVNKEYVHEFHQKNSNTKEFGNSKPRQSAVNQTDSAGLQRNNAHSVNNSRTDVSKSKGPRNTQNKKTQVDDRDCNLSQGVAVSSFGRMNKLVTLQQHTVQTLDDLPKESCELSIPIPTSLKNGSGHFADSDSDGHTSVKSVASQKECMGHCHNEASTAEGEEMDSLQVLSSENYFSQETEQKAVIEIPTDEKRTQDLPGSKPVNNTDFHSIDNVNKELASSSPQLNEGEEKEIAHKSADKQEVIM
ncbi:ankyrin repeat domain-containing protein 11 [Cricetulus griseus]|nr:ankyrin repeat domain-containing protein 11 [Cricetulus griseus]